MSKQPKIIPVVIADPVALYITGLKASFKYKEHIQMHSAESLHGIMDLLEEKKMQCLVLTDSLLEEFGNSCITVILEKFKTVKIIVLTVTKQVYALKNLIAMGASALVSKLTKGPELEEAILHVQQKDEPHYCHRILKIFALKHDMPQYVNGKKVSLSPKLVEVLLHMIDWLPYKQIALEMKLTDGSAETYCKKVKERINLSGCKSPLEYAVKMGYFTMEQYVKRISDRRK